MKGGLQTHLNFNAGNKTVLNAFYLFGKKKLIEKLFIYFRNLITYCLKVFFSVDFEVKFKLLGQV